MSYTLDSLLQDVVQRRGKVKSKDGGGDGVAEFAEVWNTFARYLRSCLDQRRGLHLGSFCRIGWQTVRSAGVDKYRPVFQLTDQFCRAHGNAETRKPKPDMEGLCPFEDFNFSKAAIKFSQLSKDQVFTGLRAIVQGIGDAVADGRDLCLEISDVGRLTCHSRGEAHFQFEHSLLAGDNSAENVPFSPVGASQRGPPSFQRGGPSAEALSLGVSGHGQAFGDTRPADDGYASQQPMTPPRRSSPYPVDHEMAPEAMQNGGNGESPPGRDHILTAQQYKREVAFKESMDRHIGEMEARASEAVKEKESWQSHVNDCLMQERDTIQMSRLRSRENSHFLKQQKHLNEERRKEQRQEDIIVASQHDFPAFTEPAAAEMKEFVHGQQARMRADLDAQVRTNTTLRNLSKQRERSLELNQLEANRSEMSLLRDAERAKKAYDREALATAWNSEIRMKNIWKAIESHNKVGSNPSQVLVTDGLPPPSRTGSCASSGRLLTGSVRRVPLGASSSLSKLESVRGVAR